MMEKRTSHSAIEEKMATMRLKNLELLKRHQEIEEDRQMAEQTNGQPSVMESNVMQRTKKTRPKGKNLENSSEHVQRGSNRRKAVETTSRPESHRLKRERVRDGTDNNIPDHRPELIRYAYPFHHQSNSQQDADEPAQAKKLVIVNNQADRIGSGRFRQPQGQRKREERMRRAPIQKTENIHGNNEFHLDVSPIPIWQNNPMLPVHVQLLPTNLNGPVDHHHLINSHSEPSIEQGPPPPYLQNYIYPTATSHPSFNNNGTIYFAPRPPPSPNPFPPFPPSRTFENSSFHQFHPLPPYPSANLFQNPHFPSGNMHHYPEEAHSMGPNRPFKSTSDRESHKPDYRSIANSYSRSATTAPATVTNQRHQRNQPTSLPLSAYMNTEQNDHSWNNNGSYQKRRSTRTSQHQFPLSSYDPRQYGFQRRGTQRRTTNNNRSNDVDLIEEWWEDESTELIGTKPVTANDDSGHSSLSTSTNTIQDTSLELSSSKLNDSTQSSSDTSTTDKQILHSLDQLQRELKFAEAIDKCLTSEEKISELKQSGTYNTAHFLQWAKKTFREELAGRLTAQEIQQHDAVTRDDDEQLGEKVDALRDDLEGKLTIEKEEPSSTGN